MWSPNSRALIIRTPTERTPRIYRNGHMWFVGPAMQPSFHQKPVELMGHLGPAGLSLPGLLQQGSQILGSDRHWSELLKRGGHRDSKSRAMI